MEQEKNVQLPPVDEPTIKFRMVSDRDVMTIVNDDIKETLVEISGYDLQINFNMQYLKSVEDINAARNGIADLFQQLIMEKLLEHRNKPEE